MKMKERIAIRNAAIAQMANTKTSEEIASALGITKYRVIEIAEEKGIYLTKDREKEYDDLVHSRGPKDMQMALSIKRLENFIAQTKQYESPKPAAAISLTRKEEFPLSSRQIELELLKAA